MGPRPEAEAALNSDPQEASRPGAPGSERILLDILEHDWREAQDSRQELCQKLHTVQGELQWAEELRDKVPSPVHHPPPALPPAFLLTQLGRLPKRRGWWASPVHLRRPSLQVCQALC